MIANFFNYCFDKWWRPVIFLFFTILVLAAALYSASEIFKTIAFILFGAGSVSVLIASVYQLVKRRWIQAAVTALIFAGTFVIAAVVFIAVFFYAMEAHDQWADDLTIPVGIQIEKPVEMHMGQYRPDSMMQLVRSKPDFQLYNSFQRGIFEYDVWLGKMDAGIVYLKAFEISKNIPLSPERLKISSNIRINNPVDSIKKFGTTHTFTIYEGDWGKPYAARFEVWYRADGEKVEIKLLSKNYIIEGWQR
jgi:hypothetical protein